MIQRLKRVGAEFKEFAAKGNVIDLAVGVIIGGAFGGVVQSLVKDVLMPPIGLFIGKVDFSSLFINLSRTPYASLAEAQLAGAPTINYGSFLNTVINFIILAFVIFFLVRYINRLHARPQPESNTKACPRCLSSIPLQATKCAHCTSDLA